MRISDWSSDVCSSDLLQVYGSAGDLDWIAGAYYFIEKGTERSDAKSFGFLNPAAPVARNTDGNIRSTSYALFGQLNYDFTDRLRATAGFRYTWDSRELVIHALTDRDRSEEHTSELQSLMRISYAVFCLKKKN